MRFLALLFLTSVALAAAVPLPSYENDVEHADAVNEFFMDLAFEADEDPKTELGKKLKEHLDQILEKIKEAIDSGKGLKVDLLEKAKDIREKLKDLKVDIGNRARELLGKLKDRLKDYWKQILDKLNPEKRSLEDYDALFAEDDTKTELGKKLKEHLDQILEKIKEAIDSGKGLKVDLLEKAKDIREKLKDLKVDIGNRARELLGKLKDRLKDYWKQILDKLNPEKRSLEDYDALFAEDDTKTELGKKLKEHLDQILEKIKEAIDNGKGLKVDLLEKAKDIREKLKDLKVDIGNRARELLGKLKDRLKDYWKQILDKLNPEKRSIEDYDALFAEDDIATRLRRRFNELLEKIKNAFENREEFEEEIIKKLHDVRQQMRDLKVDIGHKAKGIIEDLRGKAIGTWRKFLDRLHPKERPAFADNDDMKTELGKKLKDDLERILNRVKEALDEGRVIKEATIRRIKEIVKNLGYLKVDLGDEYEELKEKAKNYLKEIFDKIAEDNGDDHEEGKPHTGLGKRLREEYEALLEKLHEALDKGKDIKDGTLQKLREIRQKLRDLKVNISSKAKNLLENVKEKATDYFHRFFDKLRPKKQSMETYLADADDEVKSEVGNQLKEDLTRLLKRVKEALDEGKIIKAELLQKIKQIRDNLRDMKVDMGKQARELLDQLKEKVRDYLKKIFDRLLKKEDEKVAFSEGKLKQLFKKFKESIKDIIDKEKLKQKIEQLFGKGSEIAEQLINKLKEHGEKGKQMILDWIDRVLEDKEEKRSIKEVYDKVKDYFRDLHIELKEKFSKFGQYVKEKYREGLEKGKTRVENLRTIARKFLEETKSVGLDVGNEALEFFREYKDDLGHIFDDIKEKVREIYKKEQ